MRKSALVLGLLVLALVATITPAMAFDGYETTGYHTAGYRTVAPTDRDRLWNPFVGYAPWEQPVGYGVARTTVAAPAVVEGATTAPQSTLIVHHVRGDNIDRNLLWNPLMGHAPWLDGTSCQR